MPLARVTPVSLHVQAPALGVAKPVATVVPEASLRTSSTASPLAVKPLTVPL